MNLRNGIPDNLTAITIDTEWACEEVLRGMLHDLDERGLRATLFCPNAGVEGAGHEIALHPNLRRQNNSLVTGEAMAVAGTDFDFYRYILSTTHSFYPQATGVRPHCLYYESGLLPIYQERGLQYDSSYYCPLQSHLTPFMKEHDVLEIPLYYMDHLDLVQRITSYRVGDLQLDCPGLKVFDFHPNIVWINSPDEPHYLASKKYYHDPEHLTRMRHNGYGAGTLWVELLDELARKKAPVMTLGEINRACRAK